MALQGMRRTLTDNADIRVMIEYWPWGIAQAGGDPRSAWSGNMSTCCCSGRATSRRGPDRCWLRRVEHP